MSVQGATSGALSGLRKRAVLSLVVALGFVGGGGAWAANTEIDGAALAGGQLAVDGDVKSISHPDGGTVQKLLVKNGDAVKAGQVLIELHDPVLEAEIAASGPAIDILTIRLARLTAESEGDDTLSVPQADLLSPSSPETEEALESEQRVLASDADVNASGERQADLQTAELKRQLRQLQANESEASAQLTQSQADLAALSQLPPEQAANPASMADAQGKVDAAESQLKSIQDSIASTKSSIASQEEQRTSQDNSARLQAAQSIPVTNEDRENLRAHRDELLAQSAAMALKSPVDGVVNDLGVHGVGEVVAPGAVVAQIVPTGAKLVATIKVPTTEIDSWKPSGRVLLRFPGLSRQKTPEVWARVRTISAAPTVDKTSGESSFTAQLVLADDDVPASLRAALDPGMPVEAQLQTGRRTVLSYLLKPVSDRFDRALKEQ